MRQMEKMNTNRTNDANFFISHREQRGFKFVRLVRFSNLWSECGVAIVFKNKYGVVAVCAVNSRRIQVTLLENSSRKLR